MIDPWNNTKEAELSMTSQSPQRFNIPFEVKWSTTINNGGNGDVSISGNNIVRISKQRTRKNGDSSSSRRHASSDSMSSDRLIEDSEKKTGCSDRLITKTDDKTSSSDRLIEKLKKRKEFNGADRLIVKPEKETDCSDRLILKTDDKTVSSDRLMEKSEKKKDLNGPDRLTLKLENKTIGPDRLIEKSEKKKDSSGSDRSTEKKVRVPDRSIEKSDKKVVTVTSSDRLTENIDETVEGSDVKPHGSIDLKAKIIKLEENTVAVEESELEVKTWNLRPRKPVSKNPYVNGGVSTVLMQEINKRPQSPSRAKANTDANIAEEKVKKKRFSAFSVSLLKEEIEEDIFVMTGSKPARRPKKRPRHVQKQLDFFFPGLWLSSITPDTYKVVENVPKA